MGSRADVVLSDLSPNISGAWELDVARSAELCLRAIDIAKSVLKPGGNLVLKAFQGRELGMVRRRAESLFRRVIEFRPRATRKGSSEIYLVCLRLRAFRTPSRNSE